MIFLILATANKAILIAGTQQLKERQQFEYITLDKIADFKLLHAADLVWGGNQKTGEKNKNSPNFIPNHPRTCLILVTASSRLSGRELGSLVFVSSTSASTISFSSSRSGDACCEITESITDSYFALVSGSMVGTVSMANAALLSLSELLSM